jgi:pilus assembly protein CpaE
VSGLLVVTPCDEFNRKVAAALGPDRTDHQWYWREGLLDEGSAAVIQELMRTSASVVANGPDVDIDTALEIAGALDRERPDVVVVLVAEPSFELMDRALQTGARGVIAPDAAPEDLGRTVEKALEAADRRHNVSIMEAKATSHLICVVAPKGGAGKTTTTTNLATGLALAAPGEVVLVDLDFQFGDIASTLRLEPVNTFADIALAEAPVDLTTLKVFLTPAESGLFALCAPEGLEDADLITPEHVAHVLELLAEEFRYVIVDTGSGLDDGTLVALKQATDIIVLTSTEVPSVRATLKELKALDMLGLKQPRHFVVNRADARVGLPLAEVETTVGLPVVCAIPSSRSVPISVNQGTPVIVSDARSSVAEALSGLVATFAPSSRKAARTAPWRKRTRLAS